MQNIDKRDVRKLTEDPVSYAVLLSSCQLEQVIAAFVSVLNRKTKDRGG